MGSNVQLRCGKSCCCAVLVVEPAVWRCLLGGGAGGGGCSCQPPYQMEGAASPPTSPVKLPFEGTQSIVLDWDDTLLPTTQLTDNFGDYITGGAALPPRIVAELSDLQDDAVRFLDEVALCGGATVITNAMQGVSWQCLSSAPVSGSHVVPHADTGARAFAAWAQAGSLCLGACSCVL